MTIKEGVMAGQDEKKIFCIGFNKTGTSSLHRYFQSLGLKSTHGTMWPNLSRIPKGRRHFFNFDCYSDGEKCDFVKLSEWFPNSIFLLNTRKEVPWLRSRVKHVLRRNEAVDVGSVLSTNRYGNMAKEFFFCPESALLKWISEKKIYENQAREYFKEDKRFLEIDITDGSDWVVSLFEKIKENNIKVEWNSQLEDFRNMAKNKRSESAIKNREALEYYYEVIDKVYKVSSEL